MERWHHSCSAAKWLLSMHVDAWTHARRRCDCFQTWYRFAWYSSTSLRVIVHLYSACFVVKRWCRNCSVSPRQRHLIPQYLHCWAANSWTLTSTLRICSFINSVAFVVTFIIRNDADVFTPDSLCLTLTQKVQSGWDRDVFSNISSLKRQTTTDLNQMCNNLNLSHTNQLWTITSVTFICAGSAVSFWIEAIVLHSCRHLLFMQFFFVRVQSVVWLEIWFKSNKTQSRFVWLKLSNLSVKWSVFFLLNQSNSMSVALHHMQERVTLNLCFQLYFLL